MEKSWGRARGSVEIASNVKNLLLVLAAPRAIKIINWRGILCSSGGVCLWALCEMREYKLEYLCNKFVVRALSECVFCVSGPFSRNFITIHLAKQFFFSK